MKYAEKLLEPIRRPCEFKLSILIVNYNSGEMLLDCLDSIYATVKTVPYEVIVVDNNSQDGSVRTAREKHSEVRFIENDFNKINDILFNIINEIQDKLSRVSHVLFLLDFFGKKSDERIIDFSMRKAREQAWNSANLLWTLGANQQDEAINGIDAMVLQISKFIKSPRSRFIRFILKTIRTFEKTEVGVVISKLKEG